MAYSTTNMTLSQLVLNYNMILHATHVADWEHICLRKQLKAHFMPSFLLFLIPYWFYRRDRSNSVLNEVFFEMLRMSTRDKTGLKS